jgi:hypothetical protein
MNTFDKIRNFCRPFRIVIGLILIIVGFFIDNAWFYLGVIPLIAGLGRAAFHRSSQSCKWMRCLTIELIHIWEEYRLHWNHPDWEALSCEIESICARYA